MPLKDLRTGIGVARLVKFIAALLVGAALGQEATSVALNRQPPFGAVRSGPWAAWPTSGSADADPYARAVFARDGRIPLAAATGLAFLARTDDEGMPLDRRCSYEVGGRTPPAQFWTLTVLDPAGFVRPDPVQRYGFTSTEVDRSADDNFTIALAPMARPGNWLPLPGAGAFVLMLSFYDTPITASLVTGGSAPALPTIAKRTCR